MAWGPCPFVLLTVSPMLSTVLEGGHKEAKRAELLQLLKEVKEQGRGGLREGAGVEGGFGDKGRDAGQRKDWGRHRARF